MACVRDIVLDRVLFHVEENQTVAEVARKMAGFHVGAIIVLQDGQLRGVFSERDIMLRVVLQQLDPETTPVRDVMSTHLSTIEESATMEEALEAMHNHNCRHLPVTRAGEVVAFLSMRDVMDYQLARQTEELRHMHAYIHGTGA
jgi:CBS domain-containing protein